MFKSKSPPNDITVLNHELSLISDWFKANKLSLNVKKTNFMIFQNKSSNYENLEININGSSVPQTNGTKFLGLQIDPHLSWKNHINSLCNKFSKILGIFYRVKSILPCNILMSLYNSLILSALSYCNIVWGNTYSSYIDKLYILQKRAIRLITSSDFSTKIIDKFNDLNILTIYNVYKHQLGTFMFKISKGLLPAKFCNLFQANSSIHSHCTRYSNNFHLSSINTTFAKKSFVFTGTQFFNNLSPDIKNVHSAVAFNRKLKNYLISLQ